MRGVNHVQQNISSPNFFEGTGKCINQLVRKLINKPNRIRQQGGLAARQIKPAAGRVKCRKQLIFDKDMRLRQGIHQSRFAGICITDEGNTRKRHPGTFLAVQVTCPRDLLQTPLECRNPFTNTTPVYLQLRFPRATGADATAESRQMGPLAGQTRAQIFELGQFNLQFSRLTLGALGKDIENELTAIDDFQLQRAFKVTLLGGRQIIIKDHNIGLCCRAEIPNLCNLAGSIP